MKETPNKESTKTILLLLSVALILLNLYVYFSGNFVTVYEEIDAEAVIRTNYKDIFSQTKGFIAKFVEYMGVRERPDSLFFEKLSVLSVLIGCFCCFIGIFQLNKNKTKFLILGLIFLCVGHGALVWIVKFVEDGFQSAVNDYGILGALMGDLLTIETDTIKYFIINLK